MCEAIFKAAELGTLEVSFVTIFIAPPTAPEPYRVAAELPLIISILSIIFIGIFEKFIPPMSKSLRRIPFTNIKKFDLEASPNPLISIVEYEPLTSE